MFKRLSLRYTNRCYIHIIPQPSTFLSKHNLSAITTLNLQDINKYTNGNDILSNFFNSVQTYPYRFALIYNGEAITYRDFYYRVLQCAVFLKQKYQISPSDVIAVSTSNRPEYFQLVLASHILNCTFLPLNPMVNPNVNTEIITNTNVKLIIHEDTLPTELTDNINPNINFKQLQN